MIKRTALAASLLLASTALAACGGSEGGGQQSSGKGAGTERSAPAGGGGDEEMVTIADFAFEPDAIEVETGGTIVFSNDDDAKHTATTSEDSPEPFDTKDISGGESAAITFDEAGDYSYYCSIHEYMKGTVRVVE